MGRRRATLNGLWWKSQMDVIRHCISCGGKLALRYVSSEKKRRHVCSVCGFINYINPKVVAGLIPTTSDGKLVLLKRDIEPAKGKWTYPAGYQEIGETVEQAAIRETWEEICVPVRVTGLVGIYSYADAAVVTIVYAGKIPRGKKPKPGQESQHVELFDPSRLPWKDMAFRSSVEALKDWKTGKVRA